MIDQSFIVVQRREGFEKVYQVGNDLMKAICYQKALIESDEELYYMQINPDLRGANIPRSISTTLAGQNATFAENSLEAAEVASSMAQSDEIITYLFELYKDKKIETTFDTLMYGKPIHIRKIIDKDFNKEYKKIYTVNCILEGKKSTVKIPNAFPTFFPKD